MKESERMDSHPLRWERRDHGYRGSMGDFIQLRDGAILMSYKQDDLMAIRSTDRGETWGEPFVLVPGPRPPAKGGYGAPGFLRLRDGTILLSYTYSTHPATPYYAHNYYRLSGDEGRTWTQQFLMTPQAGYVLVHNDRMHLLPTGRILAMAEYKAYFPDTRDHSGFVGMAFFSDDGGASWKASRNVVDMQPVEVQEPDAVELRDGRLMMFARTYSGFGVRAYSEDGGETWSQGERIEGLEMPYAGLPTVRRIPATGDLLFIYIGERSVDPENEKIHRRCALTAAISKDEGRTFEHVRHIVRDPLDDFGYQCVEFLDGDQVLIGYHARDGLHVSRFGVGWFYEG